MADRIRHGHHGEAGRERNAEKSDADLRKAGGDDGASTSPERQPKCADSLGNISLVIHVPHSFPSSSLTPIAG